MLLYTIDTTRKSVWLWFTEKCLWYNIQDFLTNEVLVNQSNKISQLYHSQAGSRSLLPYNHRCACYKYWRRISWRIRAKHGFAIGRIPRQAHPVHLQHHGIGLQWNIKVRFKDPYFKSLVNLWVKRYIHCPCRSKDYCLGVNPEIRTFKHNGQQQATQWWRVGRHNGKPSST